MNTKTTFSCNLFNFSCCSGKQDLPSFPDNINRNYMEDGSDIKWEDTVEFTFPITGGRVIKCYDADTITIVSKLPYNESPMYRLSDRHT